MADFSIRRIARRGFGSVISVRGRDDRMQFWIFVALVFGPLIALQFIGQMAIMFGSVLPDMIRGPDSDPELIRAQFVTQTQQAMIRISYLTAAINMLTSILLTAAAGRRLHDRARSGWWALILPVAALLLGMEQIRRARWIFSHMFAEAMLAKEPNPAEFLAIQEKIQAGMPSPHWYSVIAALAMLWLAVELIRAGTDGPNRFGEAPE